MNTHTDNPAAIIENQLRIALEHHQAGRLNPAKSVYQKILTTYPDNPDAWHWLGVIAQQQGNKQQAVELISKALTLKTDYAEAHFNLGFALQSQDKLDAASTSFLQAITFRANFAEAYASLGNVLKAQGKLDQAIHRFRQAITFKMNFVDAHNNLGNSLREQGQLDEAIACFHNALHFNPKAADVYNNLGVALQEQGKHAAAVSSFQKALEIKPDYAHAYSNLGSSFQSLDRFDDAIHCFQQAIKFKPDFANAYNNLGLIYRKSGRPAEALKNFQQALTLNPDYAEAAYNIHDVQLNNCFWQHFQENVSAINQAVDHGLGRYLPFAFLAVAKSPAHELTCARKFASEHYPAATMPIWTGEAYQHNKIRIAYCSADFHDHATAYLMAGLFEQHNREKFEITAVSFGPESQGEMRQRLAPAFDRFVDVRHMGDREVALLMRQWQIDIAIDLKGYTTAGRPGILAQRPAPIQVSYLGYPGSLGVDYIDYILADEIVIPANEQHYYDEKVVYLPHCYQVNDNKRRIAEELPSKTELGLPADGFIFCCFNNNYKITPPLFDIWMRLLQQVPNSVLWLFQNNPTVAHNLKQEAIKRGIPEQRIVFAPAIKLDKHLARIGLADLFLDTLPYNAHTTASDALWAGLPVLTCTGNTFAGRVASSLLTAIGLPELITHNLADYEALALHLARNPDELATIKHKLRQNRLTQPLFDTTLFCRQIEAAYETMWQKQQRGEAIASFKVIE